MIRCFLKEGAGIVIPVKTLRNAVFNYQTNYPNSKLCAELLALEDDAFLVMLNEIWPREDDIND